jgi:hypothetical protein
MIGLEADIEEAIAAIASEYKESLSASQYTAEIKVKLLPRQKEFLKEFCRVQGVTISDFVRKRVFDERTKATQPLLPKTDAEAIAQLNGIRSYLYKIERHLYQIQSVTSDGSGMNSQEYTLDEIGKQCQYFSNTVERMLEQLSNN